MLKISLESPLPINPNSTTGDSTGLLTGSSVFLISLISTGFWLSALLTELLSALFLLTTKLNAPKVAPATIAKTKSPAATTPAKEDLKSLNLLARKANNPVPEAAAAEEPATSPKELPIIEPINF